MSSNESIQAIAAGFQRRVLRHAAVPRVGLMTQQRHVQASTCLFPPVSWPANGSLDFLAPQLHEAARLRQLCSQLSKLLQRSMTLSRLTHAPLTRMPGDE